MKETNLQSTLPLIRSKPVHKYIIDMTLLAQKLPHMSSDCCKIKFRSGKYEIKVHVKGDHPWSIEPFDLVVYSAVSSLYEAGNRAFTVSMVARTMMGYQQASTVSPKLCDAITLSIEKMRNLSIEIFAPGKEYRDKVLHLAPYQARNDNGTPCTHYGYVIEPVLLSYCKDLGHLSRYPIQAVNTIGQLYNTIETIVVRHFVLRRIAVVARSGRFSKISYDTIAEECGVTKAKARRICVAVLKHLTAQEIIWGHDEYKIDRQYSGTELKPPPESE